MKVKFDYLTNEFCSLFKPKICLSFNTQFFCCTLKIRKEGSIRTGLL